MESYAAMRAACVSEAFNQKKRFWQFTLIKSVLQKWANTEGETATSLAYENVLITDFESVASLLEQFVLTDEGNAVPHDITAEEIARHKTHEAWLNNPAFQRQGHAAACQDLGLSETNSRFPGMAPSASFKFWQVVAVAALLEIEQESLYRGGIEADAVGIGKTWVAIGIMHYVSA